MVLTAAVVDGRILQVALCGSLGAMLLLCAIFKVNPGLGAPTRAARNFQIMLDGAVGRVVIGALGVFLLGIGVIGLLDLAGLLS